MVPLQSVTWPLMTIPVQMRHVDASLDFFVKLLRCQEIPLMRKNEENNVTRGIRFPGYMFNTAIELKETFSGKSHDFNLYLAHWHLDTPDVSGLRDEMSAWAARNGLEISIGDRGNNVWQVILDFMAVKFILFDRIE